MWACRKGGRKNALCLPGLAHDEDVVERRVRDVPGTGNDSYTHVRGGHAVSAATSRERGGRKTERRTDDERPPEAHAANVEALVEVVRAALHGAQDLRVALGEPRGRIALHAGPRDSILATCTRGRAGHAPCAGAGGPSCPCRSRRAGRRAGTAGGCARRPCGRPGKRTGTWRGGEDEGCGGVVGAVAAARGLLRREAQQRSGLPPRRRRGR